MTNRQEVEQTLRDALLDERRRLTADHARLSSGAAREAERIRRRRSAAGAAGVMVAVVLAIAVLGSLVRVPRADDGSQVQPGVPSGQQSVQSSVPPSATRTSAAPAPSVTPSPWWKDLPASGTAPTSYTGQVEDLAYGDDRLYVLSTDEPAQVDALDPATETVLWSRPLPTLASPQPGGGRLVLDPAAKVLWAYRTSSDGLCRVDAVDAGSGGPAGGREISCNVLAMAADRGSLWVVVQGVLEVLRPGADAFQVVAGSAGADSVVVDARGSRVIFGGSDGRVTAVDEVTLLPLAVSRVGNGVKTTLAMTPDGRLWIGRYGPVPLRHLDQRTLAPIGTSPAGQSAGPGAQVWPGDTVVWMREGGAEGLACVRATDGTPLGRWTSVQGPVVSTSSPARAWAVNDRALVRLALPLGCAG